MEKQLEKYGNVTTYNETDNAISFVILEVSHSLNMTTKLYKDISKYCNWPISEHTFEDGSFYMKLVKDSNK